MLVKFFYGSTPTVYRYTDWSSDVSDDEGLGGSSFTFTSTPSMEIRLGLLTGTLDDKMHEIILSRNSFFDRISDGTPHAPVKVIVWEIIDSTAASGPTRIMHFRGRLASSVRNYEGNSDRVKLEISTMKLALKTRAGMPANDHCENVFGDDSIESGAAGKQCTVDLGPLRTTGTLTAITGKNVTITGVTTPAEPTGTRYWHRGHVEYDGTRIQIRDWLHAAATSFDLMNFPPQEWINKTVTLTPGCDHTRAVCSARWSNIANFNGFGILIPSKNPTYQK